MNADSDPELSTLLAVAACTCDHQPGGGRAPGGAPRTAGGADSSRTGPTVFSAAFDPGRRNKVVSADYSGVASIWNAATGKPGALSLGGFGAHRLGRLGGLQSVRHQVAVGYADGIVAMFDARSGKKLHSGTTARYWSTGGRSSATRAN